MKLFWLSFADDTGFLGVAIVEGRNMAEALLEAWRLKINPGGGVAGSPIPADKEERCALFRDRLLTREEAESV